MEYEMETTMVYRRCRGIMEKKMEVTTVVQWVIRGWFGLIKAIRGNFFCGWG